MNTHTILRVVQQAYDGMNLLDLSGPLQALATASKRHGSDTTPLYELTVASAEGGLITTSAGLAVMTVAIAALDTLPIDTLIAPGGCKASAPQGIGNGRIVCKSCTRKSLSTPTKSSSRTVQYGHRPASAPASTWR